MAIRPVLYQLGRVGDRFYVGDGPLELMAQPRPLLFGRLEEGTRPTVENGRVGVDDPWMSQRHARIVEGTRVPTSGVGGVRLFIEDLGSRNGVVVNGASSPRVPLIHGDIVETGRTFWVYVEERGSEPLLTAPVELGAMATWHPRLGQQLLELTHKIKSNEHVLVGGPDGAGKGFLARTLHQVSRRDGRFLHLDCQEQRPRRIVVDLFGADGGPQGKLRDAGAGTLLLENVDALSAELQDRLADALLRCSFTPENKTRAVALNVRVVATLTRRKGGTVGAMLRPALQDVLGSLRVDLPPLADRLCDLGLLLDDFLSRAKGAPAIARESCRVLFRHRFGQHVRGFARVIEAAASIAVDDDTDARDARGARTGVIELRHLPFSVAGADAMKSLLHKAQRLSVGEESVSAVRDERELTGKVPMLSATGDDGAVSDSADKDASEKDAFSSMIETDAEREHPVLASAPPRRRGTHSHLEQEKKARSGASDIWAEDVDNDALMAALRRSRGNVSAAARALGRPRALVMRWLRDLGIDPAQA